MDLETFERAAITSADIYLNYLEINEKGYSETTITKIVETTINGKASFKLTLAKPLYSSETTEIIVDKLRCDEDKIKKVKWDKKNLCLTVIPSNDLLNDFRDSYAISKIKVVSDMKFLIRKVRSWYEHILETHKKTGIQPICLPDCCSDIKTSDFTQYLDIPSDEQQDAIDTIFSSPISYIWGAPGTGKTKFVLAYTIIEYIKHLSGTQRKIIISAPTNNAVDQVLLGVIPVLEKHNISCDNILRLGTASEELYDKYPEICEIRDESQSLNDQYKTISDISNTLLYRVRFKKFQQLKEITIRQASDIQEKYLYRNQLLEKQQKLVTLIELQNKEKDSAFSNHCQILSSFTYQDRKMNSLIYKIIFFFSKHRQEEELRYRSQLEKQEKEAEDHFKKSVAILDNSLNQLEELERKLSETPDAKELLKEFSIFTSSDKNIRKIIGKKIKETDLGKLIEVCEKCFSDILPSMPSPELDHYSDEELQDLLKTAEKKTKACIDLVERIDKANVIAITADGLIGKYSIFEYLVERKQIVHYFMDEAAYCPIIKSLPAYTLNCPITYLGDHKQLPPVCEMTLDKELPENKRYAFLWMQSAIYSRHLFNYDLEHMLDEFENGTDNLPKLISCSTLDHTFRFSEKIASVLADTVYTSDFHGNTNADTIIEVIDAPKLPGELSTVNQHEAEKIYEYLNSNETGDDYAVLAPYKRQISMLSKSLKKAYSEHRIMTIHASQGKEWDVVFLSVTDANRMWFMNSLNTRNKGINIINTAVSRAKKKLVIVCDYTAWKDRDNQLICKLIKNCDKIS